jgi:hypothetical protein
MSMSIQNLKFIDRNFSSIYWGKLLCMSYIQSTIQSHIRLLC